MSEICLGCPIESGDDEPALCAVASIMADIGVTEDGLWELSVKRELEAAYRRIPDYDIAKQAEKAIGLDVGKIDQARACAQKILRDACEFNQLD